jgi:Na+-transporting NADH:ubiquinone oxidoreductase subunit NqrA
VNQQPLENVAVPTQVCAPHPAGLVGVREAAFQHFSAPLQQRLAVFALSLCAIIV